MRVPLACSVYPDQRGGSAVVLEIVRGESRSRDLANRLVEAIATSDTEGTVYLGYPVLASADDRVEIDALLVSRNHGLVAFQLAGEVPITDEDWAAAVKAQDRLFNALDSHLGRHESLRRGRKLAIDVVTATIYPSEVPTSRSSSNELYLGIEDLPSAIEELDGIDADLLRALEGALQHVSTIKPAKRRASVSKVGSKGAVMKLIEKGISNLDKWQKQAAIESPSGPQRIRGLAGSGKTVVLALKAAYLHTQHPDWQIAVTFQTRALYQQFQDLITRFTFEHSNDSPDLSKLQILHAWGSGSRSGIYHSIARNLDAPVRDWNYARNMYGMDDAFGGVCRELLDIARNVTVKPIWDAVLIDEAQDLPPEFFRLVYLFTRDPKRIVWGYDELQKLSESAMPSTDELFGTTDTGESLINLETAPGEAARDIVLPICYRNSPWALATAHALGFGVYRPDGLVQHFNDPVVWEDIGYEVVSGRLRKGSRVALRRAESSYPAYFNELLATEDAVMPQIFDTEAEQDGWVAAQVRKNLNVDELEADDILIVLPDAYTSKKRAIRLAARLTQLGIVSHHVGVQTSPDEVFLPGSVAIAHIHRAKGNEAPMVYVLDAQYAVRSGNALTRRNILFTAITRSRAWVRVCGWGDDMLQVVEEIDHVRDNGWRLEFKIPSGPELARLRRVHRDRSDEEAALLERTTAGLSEFLEALEQNTIDIEDLPPDLRTRLMREIARKAEDG